MGGAASNTVILIAIVAIGLFLLFILPKGLTGLTTSVISDGGFSFEHPSPVGTADVFGSCYQAKLQIDYHLDCSLCNSEDIIEYWWFKNAKDSEFKFIKGDKKVISAGKAYTAETSIDACAGNSYEWYVCIDDSKLSCAGKSRPFKFKAE